MATSGSTDFSMTKNDAIRTAFQLLTVYGMGRTISSEDMSFASIMLNMMLKAWEGQGIHLWTKTEGILFLQQYVNSYDLGNTARACKRSDTITTQLNAAAISGATSITVVSTTGMAATNPIGIVLTDNSLFWTTIASVTDSTTLVINSALTGASSSAKMVYVYTSLMGKPLSLYDMRTVQGFDNGATSTEVEIPFELVPYSEYINLPVKSQNSNMPIEGMFNPNLNSTMLQIFPRPIDCNYRLYFTYMRKIEDMDATGNTFDLPQEWFQAIVYQLAVRLARPYGRAAALQDIAPMAQMFLEEMLAFDSEHQYVEVSLCNYR